MSLTPELQELVSSFRNEVSTGKVTGSLDLGLATVNLLKRLIGQSKWANAAELISLIKGQGQVLTSTLKSEVTIGNLFRRVLKLIREEYLTSLAGSQEDGVESLAKMVKTNTLTSNFTTEVPDLRSKVIESVDELMTELEACSEEISAQALEHIHANEVILTIGRSRTVELFLKQAAKERKFQVIVAESAPSYQGQTTATTLAKAKIQTTVITDSAVFAIMSRVNKVIIGTNAIMANGGLISVNGSYTVALAAKHYSVPLYVCASIFKLTPAYATLADQMAFNKFVSPGDTLRGMDGKILEKIQSPTPVFEFVPPELVTLFISNVSGHAPSYVYRLLGEFYYPEDHEFTSDE